MVQGFYFARLQCSHIQAFTARFATSMQLYRPHRKTAHRALQGSFRRFDPLHRPRHQTETNGYNTACTTLEHTRARTPCTDTRYQRHAGRCTGQHSSPIIIRYIRVHGCAPVMDSCQTVQRIEDHSSPVGSSPTVCGSLASADTLSAVQTRRTC